jgi:hypothetical protein
VPSIASCLPYVSRHRGRDQGRDAAGVSAAIAGKLDDDVACTRRVGSDRLLLWTTEPTKIEGVVDSILFSKTSKPIHSA